MEPPQSTELTADVVLLDQQPTPGDEAVYTVAEFATEYKQSLPLRIRVVEGFCGKEERSIISTGDIYNFHSIKNKNVMIIKDERGTHYSITLSSPIKFGLLYNPDGDITKAMEGFHFKTIGEMTKCKTFPRVMRATKTFHSNKHGSQSSVKANEVLIIKDFQDTGRKHAHVEVFSLLSRKDKTLYQECEGDFKTDPGIVQMYLTDIIEFFGNSLPLKATLFLANDESSENEKIAHLDLEVITLLSVNTETSIVATTIWDRKDAIPNLDDDNIVPVFIPIDLKIKVALLDDKENHPQTL